MKEPGSATASSAMSSAAPCCCIWSTARRATWCGPGGRCATELAAYGGGLAEKPEIIALNKADAMTPREAAARRGALVRASGREVMLVSGATGAGVPALLRRLGDTIREARADDAARSRVAEAGFAGR